ncbi:hypothetical protein Ddye_000496 [Dipteronia dyeriana]|uniref:VQ domain-containing protein n=1 Tax=Dipteronia dyeriana TaxID=168575 RepID=A0AAD9XMI0_9ROSI|nr:hypothetical protein Ddye_000496 [Dipteronia dyeriana]
MHNPQLSVMHNPLKLLHVYALCICVYKYRSWDSPLKQESVLEENMGKKISTESVMKISKNHHKHHHHEKKQFNSLIKVLRPKVYITDPSTFKCLVQQLTGLNAAAIDHDDRISSASSSSSPLPSPSPPPKTRLLDHDHHHKVSIIDIDPDDHYTDESNSCMEATTSSDYASVDSFHHEHITSSCNMQQPVSYTEEVKQLLAYDDHDQMYYEYQLDHDHDIISEFILMNQQHQHQHQQQEKGFWDNYDVESWLLGMEPCPNISYNGCYSQIQQEVSIYDYELPEVI